MTAPAGTDPQAPGRTRMRCSDADRLAVVHRLQEAVGVGLLTLDECTERTDAAYRTTYADELPALTADLPQPAPVAPGWRTVGSTAALQARMSLLGAPTWAAAERRRRRLVLLLGALVALLLVASIVAAAVGRAPDVVVQHPMWQHDWHDHWGPG